MKLMQRLKKVKENKKGFTLVELIAVIVILGVLMAILIPNMVGYMNKANSAGDQVIGRSLYVAATALAAESKYVPAVTKTAWEGGTEDSVNGIIKMAGYQNDEVLLSTGYIIQVSLDTNGTVGLTYTTPNTELKFGGGYVEDKAVNLTATVTDD